MTTGFVTMRFFLPALALFLAAGPAPVRAEREPVLPDPAPLVDRAAKRLADALRAAADYTYDAFEVEEKLDGKGRVKERKTRTFEVFHVRGQPVSRQVAEDGQPFSPERAAKEDREVQKRVRRIAEKKPDDERSAEADARRLADVLARYEYRAVGREPVDGRPAVVLEFQARPGKAKIEGDGVARRLAGRLWVDEQDGVVSRAELHNTEKLRFGLGVVASVSELEIALQFRPVAEGVWLPSRVEMQGAGRVLLLKGFRVRQTRDYGRFARFTVSSSEEVGAPR